jgi:hypothetical protein
MAPTLEDLRVAARYAYGAGVAAAGAPLTARVRAGMTAALAVPAEGDGLFEVMEATLHLGHLEGTWAVAYQRREKLIAEQTKLVSAAWHDLADKDVIAKVAKAGLAAAQQQGLGETKRDALAAIRAAVYKALGWLAELPGWGAMRDALTAAVLYGRAEGTVAALAIAADRGKVFGFDWDLAFGHALDALSDYKTLIDGIGNQWLTQLLNRAAFDLGPVMAALVERNADYDLLSAAVEKAFSVDSDSAAFITDWLTTAAVSDGALALYTSERVQLIDFITAGDNRVCPICLDNEANGPYAPDVCPRPGRHPECRCTLAASLNPDTYAPYLG